MKKNYLLIAGVFVITTVSTTANATSEIEDLLKQLDASAWTATTTTTTTHAAGEVTIENISYTTDGADMYTLTWTPLAGDTDIKVEIKEDKESQYFTLNTVKWSAGKIDIKLPTAGNYNIKLTAIDPTSSTAVSKEYIQTIKVEWTTTTPTPTPTPTPAPQVWDTGTGPASSYVYMAILLGIVGYMMFRFRRS